MKAIFVVLAMAGASVSIPAANGATLVAQATPTDACRNYGGLIKGDFCIIDVTFCHAATLAAENICKGREGEIIDLGEIMTGPRETGPAESPRG